MPFDMAISFMKTWLKRNKIYFETFSSTLLGLMAIILSGVSIYQANKQIENEELLHQPLLKVSNDFFPFEGNTNDTHLVTVTNEGGQLTLLDGQIKSFLKIEYYKKPYTAISDRGILYVPLLNYFNIRMPSNNFQGTVIQFMGVRNLNFLDNIVMSFKAKYNELHPMTFITAEHYLEIKYRNYKGDKIIKTYRVDIVGGGREIESDKETNEILNKWDPLKGINLYDITTDNIKRLIETNGSQHPI